MGYKLRRIIQVSPGVKINFTYTDSGGRTVPPESRVTTYVPGTGISYTPRIAESNNYYKQRGFQRQKASYPTMNEQDKAFEPVRETNTYLVTAFRKKDNQVNSVGRKLMKPLSIIAGVFAGLFLLMMLVIPALFLAVMSFLCYKNIKTPFAVVCPECDAENLFIFEEEKIACRKCESTLIIQK
ncbi:hypothetical protein [Bacillus thuringiensis]|uniref:DUF4236 domain-containing protein n=1 Tax=Bacillus thuringiensis serovar toumanoffi TaxID=180862 RepID=A0ABD5HQK9_BACTU|nr:hypothetical protein [Bacillus thuringiensis]MCR6783889.1 DUF4236 domain-containing protein [Bacillus thuringiensis]MCR6861837.1 DUF4236 domain-containing protein [Bacillus thuringiensis]MCR6868699.1 DUF4236 domain-containing protein [Bacillus thuringiensis]MDW9207222.1 DUF4236 domain-containing protein [Bacillus thuringiensis serovar toumanoffi]MED2620350.1 hypothetical protein [Bacillus thuringiensis]